MFLRSQVTYRNAVRYGFRRYNSTATTFNSLMVDIKDHFGKYNAEIPSKIDSLIPIMPDLGLKDEKFQPKTINIGLIQPKSFPPGLLMECLARDPFGKDTKWVHHLRKYRRRHPDKAIRLQYESESSQIDENTFGIKSPFLNRDLRVEQKPVGKEVLGRNLFNDINLIDIPSYEYVRSKVANGTKDACWLHLKGIPTDLKASDCQMYIIAKDTEPGDLPLRDRHYIGIWSSKKEVPKDFIKADLGKLAHANEIMAESTDNVTAYMKELKESNQQQLLTSVSESTSGYRQAEYLITSIGQDMIDALPEHDFLEELKISDIKACIADWAQNSHRELQDKVDPYMDEVIIKKFSKISKIAWNSDSLVPLMANGLFQDEAVIKKPTSFITYVKEEAHGSLVDTSLQLSDIRKQIEDIAPKVGGKEVIDGAKNKNCTKMTETRDPMVELKDSVIKEKLPQVQTAMNRILMDETKDIPLPVFCVLMLGYIVDWVSFDAGCAIFTFSVAWSAYRASGKVLQEMKKFKNWYMEKLRLAIDSNLIYLNDLLSENAVKYRYEVLKKKDLVKKVNELGDKLAKEEEKLEQKKPESNKK